MLLACAREKMVLTDKAIIKIQAAVSIAAIRMRSCLALRRRLACLRRSRCLSGSRYFIPVVILSALIISPPSGILSKSARAWPYGRCPQETKAMPHPNICCERPFYTKIIANTLSHVNRFLQKFRTFFRNICLLFWLFYGMIEKSRSTGMSAVGVPPHPMQ